MWTSTKECNRGFGASPSDFARGDEPASLERISAMCRNIRVLLNFDPPTTDEEVQAAAEESKDQSKIHHAHGPAHTQRQFRRKSGG